MKKLLTTLQRASLMASLAVTASAAGPMSYSIDGVGDPDYGTPTSIEVVHTADGGAMKNEDVSKNAALIPPGFGSASADALNTGFYLTPNLAPATAVGSGAIINGTGGNIIFPTYSADDIYNPGNPMISYTGYTEVTSDLYYSGGHLGTLKIPELDLSVRIYQGTGSSTLAKGVGHFTETSIWDGNVALAAHNRGANSYFGEIHTLELGDRITLTTKLGTRTYEVYSVSKVSETDTSALASSTDNLLTLYTCVRNQSQYRWCVQARQVV